ncbi:hypothetical protein HKD37_19G054876 [Glycine soja]|uniref:Protein transport protein Sec24-like isoform E n=1 Tax=Glycine soja TaxID=3848 RepID=A0A445FK78_GLYSO|nr:Protein transport protein Sec24-like isoform E [Glycine soja]
MICKTESQLQNYSPAQKLDHEPKRQPHPRSGANQLKKERGKNGEIGRVVVLAGKVLSPRFLWVYQKRGSLPEFSSIAITSQSCSADHPLRLRSELSTRLGDGTEVLSFD